MAYISLVNPAMVSRTGMDFGSAIIANRISVVIASITMGLYTKFPIALASGMGESVFFTYAVCLTMGISWQVAAYLAKTLFTVLFL